MRLYKKCFVYEKDKERLFEFALHVFKKHFKPGHIQPILAYSIHISHKTHPELLYELLSEKYWTSCR